MRLIPHLVAADVRRHWPVLSAWLLLVAGATVLDGVQPALAAAAGWQRVMSILAELLWLARLLAAFVAVPSLIQTHTLVGSDAFWMTRPIPPRALLLSKVVVIAVVMIGAPVVAEAVLMAVYRVPPGRLATVAVESAIWQTFWMGLLTTAAVLTRNLTGFALLVGGTLGVVIAVLATMLSILMLNLDEEAPSRHGGLVAGDPTPGLVWMLLLIAAAAWLAISQYDTRRRIRSACIGAVGAVLAFLIAGSWPWPVLVHRLELPSWARNEAALRLTADGGSVHGSVSDGFGRPPTWQTLNAAVRIEGVRPGWSANAGVLDATFRTGRGATVPSPYSSHPAAVPTEWDGARPGDGVIANLLGVDRIVTPGPPADESFIPVFFIRTPEATELEGTTGSYHGRFQVQLVRRQLEAALPLRRGASHQRGSHRLVIEDVQRTTRGVVVFARQSRATSLFDQRPTAEFSFYLRSTRAGEAVAGFGTSARDTSPLLSLLLPFHGAAGGPSTGFHATGQIIDFAASGKEVPPLRLDDAWMAAADLAVVRTTEEGLLERTLDIENFSLRVRAPPAARAPSPPAQASCDVQLGQRVALTGIVDAQ